MLQSFLRMAYIPLERNFSQKKFFPFGNMPDRELC
jgi:hypothetical protein